MSSQDVCFGNPDLPIRVAVYDWDLGVRPADSDFLGAVTASLHDLCRAAESGSPLHLTNVASRRKVEAKGKVYKGSGALFVRRAIPAAPATSERLMLVPEQQLVERYKSLFGTKNREAKRRFTVAVRVIVKLQARLRGIRERRRVERMRLQEARLELVHLAVVAGHMDAEQEGKLSAAAAVGDDGHLLRQSGPGSTSRMDAEHVFSNILRAQSSSKRRATVCCLCCLTTCWWWPAFCFSSRTVPTPPQTPKFQHLQQR